MDCGIRNVIYSNSLKDITGEGVKMVERAGMSIKNLIWTADPWGGVPCRSLDCGVCQNEDQEKQICGIRNVIYSNSCVTCKKSGREAVYVGETSRSLKERSR